MKHVKAIIELITEKGRYKIIWNDEHNCYFAINVQHIDENGFLKTEYNGIQGCANGTLNECINERVKRDEIRILIDKGVPFAEAFDTVYGLV